MKTTKYLGGPLFCVILLVAFSCQDKQTKEELDKFKQAELLKTTNIELAKKFYKYLDELNFDTLRTICDPNIKVYYESGDPGSFTDMEPSIKMFYSAFPDYKHQIDDIYAADDKVTIRLTYTGTHTNDFMEIKPTGNKFKYKGIHIYQFSSNKIINAWIIEDELGLMSQLGMELKPIKKK
jgi:predicted ester cyclase